MEGEGPVEQEVVEFIVVATVTNTLLPRFFKRRFHLLTLIGGGKTCLALEFQVIVNAKRQYDIAHWGLIKC